MLFVARGWKKLAIQMCLDKIVKNGLVKYWQIFTKVSDQPVLAGRVSWIVRQRCSSQTHTTLCNCSMTYANGAHFVITQIWMWNTISRHVVHIQIVRSLFTHANAHCSSCMWTGACSTVTHYDVSFNLAICVLVAATQAIACDGSNFCSHPRWKSVQM